jgi:hypothetical protein
MKTPAVRTLPVFFIFLFYLLSTAFAETPHVNPISSESAVSSDENMIDNGSDAAIPDNNVTLPPSTEHAITDSAAAAPAIDLSTVSPAEPLITRCELRCKEASSELASFHRLKGIYGTVSGIVAILSGIILLDDAAKSGFGMALITLGGINVGLGLWEIKLGGRLEKNTDKVK